jgi:hypothetical protein
MRSYTKGMDKKNEINYEKLTEINQNLIAFGVIDFELNLNLTEIECKYYNVNYDNFVTLQGLKDCFNLTGILNQIVLNSNNSLITSLIYLNKSNTKKTFIKFVSLNPFKSQFLEEEEFMYDVVKYVTEQNYILLNTEEGICEITDCPVKIRLKIKLPNKDLIIHEFCKKTQDQSSKNNEQENEQPTNKEDVDNDNTKALKDMVKVDFEKFNFIFLDVNDFFYLQKNYIHKSQLNSLKILNFIKFLIKSYKNIKLILTFGNIITNFSLITSKTENIQMLQELLNLSEICFYERKDALAFFNLINELNADDSAAEFKEDDQSSIKNKNETIKTFFHTNIRNRNYYSFTQIPNKTNIFIEDLNKIFIIEKSQETNRTTFENEYQIEIHKKINHTNQIIIDQYKKQIFINYEQLKAVFIGGFISRLINKCAFYSCFLAGQEITHRILDLLYSGTELMVNPEYYLVSVKLEEVKSKVKNEIAKKKEGKFVLDCINEKQSQLKFYNPLRDSHLRSFFNSNSVLKQLRSSGFVDINGHIVDPIDIKRCQSRPTRFMRVVSKYENLVIPKKTKKKSLDLNLNIDFQKNLKIRPLDFNNVGLYNTKRNAGSIPISPKDYNHKNDINSHYSGSTNFPKSSPRKYNDSPLPKVHNYDNQIKAFINAEKFTYI